MTATLQPRSIVRGEDGEPFLTGDFYIPGYQRGYRWGDLEVRQLLEDIKRTAIRERQDYLLQPIVVLPLEGGAWELVDGQQRLTTLYLILKYIGTLLPFVTPGYALTYETRSGSRQYLETLHGPDGESRRADNIDFHHMFDAYATIRSWFTTQANPSKAASDMHSALSEFVKVIWYEAPEGTIASELFARLNVARIPLTDAELIKAVVLSSTADPHTGTDRREQIAAQWDGIERDLRDEDFWAFLTGSSDSRPTHIDILFESMTTGPADRTTRPRYWTFGQVGDRIAESSAEAFWRAVVEHHGLLTGWFEDSEYFHLVGYLTATGDSIAALLDAAKHLRHSEVREMLRERIRSRLHVRRERVGTLRYGRAADERDITRLLLLANVETVRRQGGRFSFHEFVSAGARWSLEHIHAQNAQGLTTEAHWRAWLEHHIEEVGLTRWDTSRQQAASHLEHRMSEELSRRSIRRDDALAAEVIKLFTTTEDLEDDEEIHGIENLALLQRELNSELNDAVFSVKRRRLLDHDFRGRFIPPCTRNVFLKYYSDADGQALHMWGPDDRTAYTSALLDLLDPYLEREQTGAVA